MSDLQTVKKTREHFPPTLRIYNSEQYLSPVGKEHETAYHVIFESQYLSKTQAEKLARKISKTTQIKIERFQPKPYTKPNPNHEEV